MTKCVIEKEIRGVSEHAKQCGFPVNTISKVIFVLYPVTAE